MSEKKAPEKKEKEKLVHVTEEQLKAGKEEIMKIVNDIFHHHTCLCVPNT